MTAMQSYTQKVPKSQSYIRHQRRIRSFCPCTQGIGVGASAAPCTRPVGGIKEGGSARFLWGRPLPSGCSGSYKCLNSSVTLVGCAWMILLLHCFGATHFRGATVEVISAWISPQHWWMCMDGSGVALLWRHTSEGLQRKL